jgi:hypothetical protein
MVAPDVTRATSQTTGLDHFFAPGFLHRTLGVVSFHNGGIGIGNLVEQVLVVLLI